MSLKDKTIFVNGGSRGIGLAIALKCARDGANVAVASKTAEPHPHLPGTIYTAAEEIEEAGGRALPIVMDVRNENAVEAAIDATVEKFGGLDICINNASAISLTGTLETDIKRYDLMHQINLRGTFVTCRAAIPHLKKADNPHVLVLAPPPLIKPEWFKPHVAYTIAKYGMSLCVLGMAEEFREDGVAFNALWPHTAIATSAIRYATGTEESLRACRSPEIMADAAYEILTRPSRETTGNFFIDDQLLAETGVEDFARYRCDPSVPLRLDLFVDESTIPEHLRLASASG